MSFRCGLSAVAAIGLLCGSGCSSKPATGFLSVGVNAPSGVSPGVTVTGPNGYSQAVTTSTVLTVPTGSYTVVAAMVSTTGGAVNAEYTATVTGSPAAVAANTAVQVGVEYNVVPGTGMIWIPGYDSFVNYGGVLGFAPFGIDPQQEVTFFTQSNVDVEGLALDSQGAIWGVDSRGQRVIKFSASQLAESNAVTPAVIIANNYDGGLKDDGGYNLLNPEFPAFDPQGNLWVGDVGTSSLVKYTNVGQLSGLVVTEPAVILDGGPTFSPYGLAFDSSGNLWVSDYANDQVLMYSNPSALSGSVSPSPAIVLQNVTDGGTPAFTTPFGLAFDSEHNLWIANLEPSHNASIAKIAAAKLSASGEVAPDALLINGAPDTPFRNAEYIAFDQQGNLWVGDNNRASEFAAADVSTASGTEALDAGWIFFYNNGYGAVLVDPSPTNLPLYH